jgi:glutaredoxin
LKVTLYTKPECGLCEEAAEMLARLQKVIRFELESVNIETDSSTYRKFWDRIPVVAVDGEEVAVAPLDEKILRAALAK